MILVSVMIGWIYVKLFDFQFFIDLHKNYLNREPNWFWDMLPLVVVNFLISLCLHNKLRERIKLFFIGSLCSIFTMYIIIIPAFINGMKNFD